jgi:hypothetical protein
MSRAPSLRHEDGGPPHCSTAHDEDCVDNAALLFVGTTPWTKALVTHLLAEAIFSTFTSRRQLLHEFCIDLSIQRPNLEIDIFAMYVLMLI